MRRLAIAIVALNTEASAFAAAGPDGSSRLSVSPAGPAGITLVLTNAGNQAWTLQSSSNLTSWTTVDAWKIHNGYFRRNYGASGHPGLVFRAVENSSEDRLASTSSAALILPAIPFNYANPTLPPAFFVPPILGQDNTPSDNLTTDTGATLGRVLFYDRRLSANQTVSCASCHQQAFGFSDPRRFSIGFDGTAGPRNSMGLSHARWYERERFFWDERAATLEDQVLRPVQDPSEMGMALDELIRRLALEPFYTNLFTVTFGTPDITTNRISRALAQFVRSIVSVRTKFDRGVATAFSNFTPEENLGRQIFNGQIGIATCTACHGTDNFVPGPVLNNNGLEFPYVDRGAGAVTGNPADNGKFKVPSLRNIELTAPYMHDGRFATLEEVVEFYNSGVVNNPNLPPPLRNPNGTVRRLNLTTGQKSALVAFLKTLTDPGLAADPKYSDPFNYGF